MTDRKIITLAEAREAGLTKYFSGVPCKHGHMSERYTKSNSCIECRRNIEKSGRQDGKKLQPNSINVNSIPMPVLDETRITDLSNVEMDTTGIMTERLTKKEWLTLAQMVEKVGTFRQWLIGDLWNLCEWGSKGNMMESMGISAKTAQEYGRVCSRIPHDMRRGNLSFSHHQEVCVQVVETEEMMVMVLDRVEEKWFKDRITANHVRKMMRDLSLKIAPVDPGPQDQFESIKDFLKKYKKLGKRLKSLEDIPHSLQDAFDNLNNELKKLEE